MPRKAFLQDLEHVKRSPPAHLIDIERYDGDGISLSYCYIQGGSWKEAGLKLITTDVDEYPEGNQFMIFTDDVDVDPLITNAFTHIQAIIDGTPLMTALRELSGGLQQALTSGQAENPITLDSSSQISHDSDLNDFGISENDDPGDDASFGLEDMLHKNNTAQRLNSLQESPDGDSMSFIKRDLCIAHDAGFKIGVHGNLSKAGIVCISVKIRKLGISEEALQAWTLSLDQYLVLLIRFQRGYSPLAQIMEEATLSGAVEMRVGLCDTYKPRCDEAFAAFNQIESGQTSQSTKQPSQIKATKQVGDLNPLFIGRPMNDLLRERFPKIIKFRQQFDLSWCGAEKLYNDRQGALFSDLSKDMNDYKDLDDIPTTRALKDLVLQDHLSSHSIFDSSLPLVAMQFVLRHLVRCTEFCLVCHCKIEDTFEALKPYVCSNPLCLYQFMALGFGPAAEWEIVAQPYVVDLLVCLCYSQARGLRMKEFPIGISLKVPILPHFKTYTGVTGSRNRAVVRQDNSSPLKEAVKSFKARFNLHRKILSPDPGSWKPGKPPVCKGDWIVLVPISSSSQQNGVHHCRVLRMDGYNFVLGSMIWCPMDNLKAQTESSPTDESGENVDCYLYDNDFDDLPDQYRSHAIAMLINTIPSVTEMRNDLLQQQRGHRDASLTSLQNNCPQAALDLLRWIIASNRSCIMQVDDVTDDKMANPTTKSSESRVSGMDEWMQFRFAQGAPDKEQRFVDCVKSQSTNQEHPTLFAWHGSPLYNWHSIIRQGLNFDEILHGRASGHGVYMSPYVSTSLTYLGGPPSGYIAGWQKTSLKISSVMSLQEVVNAPQSFVSQTPHFVVAEKDWIQTRYLFVKTHGARPLSTGSKAGVVYAQDPLYVAMGTGNKPITIPITAISKSRRPVTASTSTAKIKKRKVKSSEVSSDSDVDDSSSIATDEMDREWLTWREHDFEDDETDDVLMTDAYETSSQLHAQTATTKSPNNTKKRHLDENRDDFILDKSKTRFIPGTLDTTDIQFLSPPIDASIMATKALQRSFRETLKIQETTPLHELGFYIDPNRLENMYQWVIELHSFEKTLPLAQDMEAAGVTSIVIEMLFTNDFPFSPPFVRVVKPRFLDPMMGGGGHITHGGAICMELLTSSGWSAVNSIESVLLQVRLAMSERERPARLLQNQKGYQTAPYSVGEAIEAYKRFCQKHGWQAPKNLDSLRHNGKTSGVIR